MKSQADVLPQHTQAFLRSSVQAALDTCPSTASMNLSDLQEQEDNMFASPASTEEPRVIYETIEGTMVITNVKTRRLARESKWGHKYIHTITDEWGDKYALYAYSKHIEAVTDTGVFVVADVGDTFQYTATVRNFGDHTIYTILPKLFKLLEEGVDTGE